MPETRSDRAIQRRRDLPLQGPALLFAAGVLGAKVISVWVWLLLWLGFVLLVAALLWRKGREPILYALIVLCGLTDSTLHRAVLSPCDLRLRLGPEPHLGTIRGELLETPVQRVYERGDQLLPRTLARLKVTALRLNKDTWQRASGEIAASTPGCVTNVYSGQRVEITGVIGPPPLPVAPGTFNYREFLALEGIHYLIRSESQEADWLALDQPGIPLADRFATWGRAALSRGTRVEDESLRLEWALALGWKTALTEKVCEPFVQAATYHIFAVDGLRMAIVFGIFFCGLRAAGLPRELCGIVVLPVIWFYVALTGWPASAIRAAVMLTIVLASWILRRPCNPLNSLYTAALFILLWEPQQLFQAGFQLSFLVVLCLILTIPWLFDGVARLTAPEPLLPELLRFHMPRPLAIPVKYLGELVTTSAAAWFGSIPLVAYYFHIITPVSIPANVVAVPLCVLALISNFIALLLAGWWPGAAEVFNHAGWFGMECIRVTSQWFAKWPLAYWYCPAPSLFGIGLYYALLLAVVSGWLFRPAFRLLKASVVGAAVLVWLFGVFQQATTTRLSVLPASGGMVVYSDPPGKNRDVLIDAGASNSVALVTEAFLRGQGVNHLPMLVLTHGDIKHTGGAESTIDSFQVHAVFTGPMKFRSVPYRKMLERLQAKPGLVRTLIPGGKLGDWNILHPFQEDRFSRADDGCVVLTSQIGSTRVLLLSDLGPDGQKALCERYPDLRGDIVIAGLPANGEPLEKPLLERLRPKLIVIADSDYPVSERAKPALRARLQRCGALVLFTVDIGAVTLEFRNGRWRATTMSDSRFQGDH